MSRGPDPVPDAPMVLATVVAALGIAGLYRLGVSPVAAMVVTAVGIWTAVAAVIAWRSRGG